MISYSIMVLSLIPPSNKNEWEDEEVILGTIRETGHIHSHPILFITLRLFSPESSFSNTKSVLRVKVSKERRVVHMEYV